MKFKEYLTLAVLNEAHKSYENEATLILHKITDMIDDAHVDYTENQIKFNVGQLIKKGKYKNLGVVIRKSSSNKMRFGIANQSGQMAIVIDTIKFPQRHMIDDFLNNKNNAEKFVKAFHEYLEIGHNHNSEENEIELTSHEQKNKNNTRESFETSYNALVKAINEKIKEFKSVTREVESQVNATGHHGKRLMLKTTINKLIKEYFGSSEREFNGIVGKLPEAKFIQTLQPDLKKKVLSRITDFYEDTIVGLTKIDVDREEK